MSRIIFNLPSAMATVFNASRRNAPIDTLCVERLRAAVLAGTYRVDPRKIADRLVELEKRLP